jgi:hypothetical protein
MTQTPNQIAFSNASIEIIQLLKKNNMNDELIQFLNKKKSDNKMKPFDIPNYESIFNIKNYNTEIKKLQKKESHLTLILCLFVIIVATAIKFQFDFKITILFVILIYIVPTIYIIYHLIDSCSELSRDEQIKLNHLINTNYINTLSTATIHTYNEIAEIYSKYNLHYQAGYTLAYIKRFIEAKEEFEKDGNSQTEIDKMVLYNILCSNYV